jgi:hypothetical protein
MPSTLASSIVTFPSLSPGNKKERVWLPALLPVITPSS